jgi:hypothetical protein
LSEWLGEEEREALEEAPVEEALEVEVLPEEAIMKKVI